MSPSTVEFTSVRVTPRAAAMFAMAAVRQAARAWSTNSTGVAPSSPPVRTAGGPRRSGLVLVGTHAARTAVGVDGAAAVRAVDPAVGGPELELRELRLALDRVQGREQGGGVDAVTGTAHLFVSATGMMPLSLIDSALVPGPE